MGATADIVRGQFEAVNRRDFAAAMDAYADDVELIAPPGLMSGTYRGKKAVGEWFGDWFQALARPISSGWTRSSPETLSR